jgi:hypothetical protein
MKAFDCFHGSAFTSHRDCYRQSRGHSPLLGDFSGGSVSALPGRQYAKMISVRLSRRNTRNNSLINSSICRVCFARFLVFRNGRNKVFRSLAWHVPPVPGMFRSGCSVTINKYLDTSSAGIARSRGFRVRWLCAQVQAERNQED